MRLNIVMKVVIVVDAPASLGIFRRELLVMINENLAVMANSIDRINRQFKIKCKKLFNWKRLPEIRDLLPNSTIDAAVVAEKITVQKMTSCMFF